MKKILFTSVGRRVELVQQFRNAANGLNMTVEIYGGDIDMTAPALCFCDKKVMLPKINASNYILFLIEYCKENSIDLVIPTIDTDLLILAREKHRFEDNGVKVLISKLDKVNLCRNKNFTAEYFEYLGLKAPHTVNDVHIYTAGFPAFIKPKDGSSSINAFRVENMEDLISRSQRMSDYVVQPFVEGKEYTVDVLCDFEGNPIFITPRERLAVRAGEVLKTKIHHDETIINDIKMIINDFKPCGPITVQLIQEDSTGINYFIEINPRFGGGAPLSMKAGANSAIAILQMLNSEELQYVHCAAKENSLFSRFDQSIQIL